MNFTYTWETDPTYEMWRYDVFDTIEECLADAKENHHVAEGETIYIGECHPYIPTVNADNVLEDIEEIAYDEYGDTAETWQPSVDVSQDKIDELSEVLTSIVNKWLKDNHAEPDFYQIENIKEYTIE